MQIEMMNFVANLKYMGVGMLGVFLVIGAIIGAVYALQYGVNRFTTAKSKSDN